VHFRHRRLAIWQLPARVGISYSEREGSFMKGHKNAGRKREKAGTRGLS
jgi:hypothetical protein